MFTLLHQCHLCWLGHIHRMEDGHIPKDLLYGELATGARCRGCPQLCYKDVCKHDMRACNIDTGVMGSLCRWQNPVEATSVTRTEKRGGCHPRKKRWKIGQENSQSSAGPPRPTSSIGLHMQELQQTLQIQDWPLQPHKTMLISNLSRCYSIVDRLTDANSHSIHYSLL